jgi:hypothetical protein
MTSGPHHSNSQALKTSHLTYVRDLLSLFLTCGSHPAHSPSLQFIWYAQLPGYAAIINLKPDTNTMPPVVSVCMPVFGRFFSRATARMSPLSARLLLHERFSIIRAHGRFSIDGLQVP